MISQSRNSYYGLSTDTKPTNIALNGRRFKEMDKSREYLFDKENEQWLLWDGGGTQVDVTGDDPVISGAANTFYSCGEVDSLSITPPESGIVDILFTSGSTPTVLTLPDTVVMPDWWAGVEANRTYEISILDGVWAVVTSWANS